jgi:hypothetical protein
VGFNSPRCPHLSSTRCINPWPHQPNQRAIGIASAKFATFNIQNPPPVIGPSTAETGWHLADLRDKQELSVLPRCTLTGAPAPGQPAREKTHPKYLLGRPSHNGFCGLFSDPRVSAFPIGPDVHIADALFAPTIGLVRLEPAAIY